MRPRSNERARLAGGAVLAICLVSPARAETARLHPAEIAATWPATRWAQLSF